MQKKPLKRLKKILRKPYANQAAPIMTSKINNTRINAYPYSLDPQFAIDVAPPFLSTNIL